MSPAEEALLRAVRAGLAVEGSDFVASIDVLLSGALAEKRSRKAVNQANLRERKRQHSGNVAATQGQPIGSVTATESATFGGSGGSLSSLSSLSPSLTASSDQNGLSCGSTREAEESGSFPVVAEVHSANATADGCDGMAVQAWADGVSSVTRKEFSWRKMGGVAMAKVTDAMRTHCRDVSQRVDWARRAGAEWAASAKTLSPGFFADWLNSPASTEALSRRGPRYVTDAELAGAADAVTGAAAQPYIDAAKAALKRVGKRPPTDAEVRALALGDAKGSERP